MPDPFDRFLVVFSAGLGLALVGGANLLLRRSGRGWRAAATVAACAVALAAPAILAADRGLVLRVGGLLACGVIGCATPGSARLRAAASRLAGLATRPAGRWAATAGVGVFAVVGSGAVYDAETDATTAAFDRRIALLVTEVTSHVPNGLRVVTDLGTPVEVRQAVTGSAAELAEAEQLLLAESPLREGYVRVGPAREETNCHGWVFAAGRYRVPGTMVGIILSENGYAQVADVRPGDVAVYRSPEGVVLHTAVVRYVTAGMPILVEGKWGSFGVFLHPAESSPYGAGVTYYRSPRAGHTLVGIETGTDGPTSPSAE